MTTSIALAVLLGLGARAPSKAPVEGPPDDLVREVVKSLDASAVERVSLERYATFGLDALAETSKCLTRTPQGAKLVIACDGASLTVVWPPKSSDDVATLLSNAIRLVDPDHEVRSDRSRAVARGLSRATDDPFTAYLPPELVAAVSSKNTAMFAATPGVEIWPRDPTKVREVRRGSDASRAGIEAGDHIISIDGDTIAGLTFPEIAAKLQGANDSIVRFTMKTAQGDKQFQVARTLVPESDVVTRQLENGVLYVMLPVFKQKSAEKIKQILWDVRPAGVILDLRHNGGGFVPEAYELADAFLKEGPLAGVRSGPGRPSEEMRAKTDGNDIDCPLVVLVDGGSASASELLAMVLKERKRAVVLGTTTSGKGSMQRQIFLPDGGVLKVTFAYYVGPLGNRLPENGVTPDRFLAPAQAKTVLEGGDIKRDSWILSALDALQLHTPQTVMYSGQGPEP
ncbi:MAG TPA: S41 family peptidase [Myxococcota bacterium]